MHWPIQLSIKRNRMSFSRASNRLITARLSSMSCTLFVVQPSCEGMLQRHASRRCVACSLPASRQWKPPCLACARGHHEAVSRKHLQLPPSCTSRCCASSLALAFSGLMANACCELEQLLATLCGSAQLRKSNVSSSTCTRSSTENS